MANTTIAIKKSATAAAIPSVLQFGELAINYADGKLFYKNVNSSIVEFSPTASSFGTVNANNTLVVSDTVGDILTILSGNNISIVGDAVNDRITVGLQNDLAVTSVSATGNISAANLSTTGQIVSTKTNSTVTGEGQLYLNGSTGNRLDFNTEGTGAPAFTTRSVGTKIVLYPTLGASQADYALGINAGTLWSSIPGNDAGQYFKWYGGTTQVASLSGIGDFNTTGVINGSILSSTQSSGDEGGQVELALAATNNLLNGSVAIDINQSQLRIFETGGTNRGVYINLLNAATGVGTDLLAGSSGTDAVARAAAGAAFDKANSANVLAFNTGVGANAFASATIAGANTAVGAGANAYSAVVGAAANTIAIAAFNKANSYSNAFSTTAITSPLTWNSSSQSQYALTAQDVNFTVNADSGSPVDGQKMIFRFKDDGTIRNITWTTGSANSFRQIGTTLPTATVANKTVYVGIVYNTLDSRWDVIAVAQEA